MKAVPTWNEIREVEYVRQSGVINMAMGDLVNELLKNGFFQGASWIQRCKDNHQFWGNIYSQVVGSFEKDHGPRDSWITNEFKDAAEEKQIIIEEMLLQRKIDALKARKNARKTKTY